MSKVKYYHASKVLTRRKIFAKDLLISINRRILSHEGGLQQGVSSIVINLKTASSE
jgi:hypothetical protein